MRMGMKRLSIALLLLSCGAGMSHAQTASDLKNGGEQKRPGETEEQKGKRLLDEMLKALGGDAWLNKQTMYREGQSAPFFRGEPSGLTTQFVEYVKFAHGSTPWLERQEFLTWRGMIMPGKKRDVVHIWDATQGYEVTFKGQTTLPEKQVTDYMRRRAHSLEEVMRTWVKQPGAIILAEGSGMRDRRPVDKVTILAANSNDAVTIEIDQETHLPLQRSFEWRNEQFKDKDIDEEVYGDWRIFDGVETPMNRTDYRNGDIAAQIFYTKVRFNQPMADDLFDHTKLLKK
jgi:hypothetical protein